jgi:hypothetical protein
VQLFVLPEQTGVGAFDAQLWGDLGAPFAGHRNIQPNGLTYRGIFLRQFGLNLLSLARSRQNEESEG